MKRQEVETALATLREMQEQWDAAIEAYRDERQKALKTLLHEAAANFMSADDIAEHLGVGVPHVRALMRRSNLDPKRGKKLLSKQAARTLAENAALLGIDVRDMDLNSPLAYLPMGKQMREMLGADE